MLSPPPPALITLGAAPYQLVPAGPGVAQPAGSTLVENPTNGDLFYLIGGVGGGSGSSGCAVPSMYKSGWSMLPP